jgi:hypothetical protein
MRVTLLSFPSKASKNAFAVGEGRWGRDVEASSSCSFNVSKNKKM